MTHEQWQLLVDVLAGKEKTPLATGFIIDSPWLPGWFGVSTLDYFTSDAVWLEANRRAMETFPETMFLPGFWAEYGMCTEPSAFGAKCTFHRNKLPFADKIIHQTKEIDRLKVPKPEKDGLNPFVLNRLALNRKEIEKLGHQIRFAVSRGPLNIASFLMGTTEFLTALALEPEPVHRLLRIITDYIIRWLGVQKKYFDTIDGVLILDDIVGFLGKADFETFAQPYLKEIYGCLNVTVRFFHNDADGRVCAPYLAELGVNLFNFSFQHSLAEMKDWTGGQVTLLGNIPPRDVLAQGRPEQVRRCVHETLKMLSDRRRVILSCGGGVPDGVSTENLRAFLDACKEAVL
ncbi:MAG TPA: uroporphyrinogen decarboxylase family protein [Anaerohalosphaeraceae bacterium]|nr:uroporphyrinogen decarboxylase family protein [Anaerohalosphaeraceae bacterium]